MKKFFQALVIILLAVSCTKGPSYLKVNPQAIDMPVQGGGVMVSVRCDGNWTLKVSDAWCRASQSSGAGNSTITITGDSNIGGELRTASIVFYAGSLAPVTLEVSQSGETTTTTVDTVYPDASSGITVDPEVPNADQSCTIKFNPVQGNPLYNHSGELYAHLGVVVDGEWQYVVSEWGTTDEKVHFTKVANNSWELKLEPTIREYFGSGETPITMIAMIVRSANGNIKSHDADQFCTVTDDVYKDAVFTPDEIVYETMPASAQYGININSDNSVTFVFYDRDLNGSCHNYCYIVGDWNNWERVSEGAMKRDRSAGCWWITLDGFDPTVEYRFQYRLGTSTGTDVRVSDPYTEIVYDQWNDQYLSGVREFPSEARALISAFRIERPAYNWQVPSYKVEDRNDLVIYEMHFRDFTSKQNIAGALENLDYIVNLGVNAVQLMPVQEFDGNNSWGYNPNHWFALDKAYGTREEYKNFIDECHKRGLAVILDVVYNHATGNHSWAKLWWDSSASCTTDANPWFNKAAKHPYNVYHDINHENEMVRSTIKQSLAYLLTEYKFDGFRFDLSKGFTQNMTDPDVTAWGHYDQSRINILEDYGDYIRSVNENAVVILEHFSDSDEEKVLAEHGLQLWRNVNSEYCKAMSGSVGNFTNVYSSSPFGGFVGYMESHDEERMCYGNTSSSAALTTAMKRAACCAAFFLTVPGPKMIWQFGEIGYDYSINYNDRTGEKPVVTDTYLSQPERKALYDEYASLLKFRRENPRFFDSDASFTWTPSSTVKTIRCSVDGKSFFVVGNFGKSTATYTLPDGDWTDWKSGEKASGTVSLAEGEYKLIVNL